MEVVTKTSSTLTPTGPLLCLLRLLGPDAPDNQPDGPATWTPGPSAALDWLTLVDADLRSLDDHLRDLRRALEKAVLP